GLNHANVVLRNTLIGAFVKTVAMLILTMHPAFGIHGAVISLNLGITLVTMLHFVSLVKGIGFTIQAAEFLKIGAAMLAMGYASSYMSIHWLYHLPVAKMLFISCGSGFVLYLALLVALRILGKQDVKRIPWIGDQLAIFFPRR
ncbi:MAG: polysaccharide biosynthesis C-terminal domain-containing protein, partial [Clostridia bacterium]